MILDSCRKYQIRRINFYGYSQVSYICCFCFYNNSFCSCICHPTYENLSSKWRIFLFYSTWGIFKLLKFIFPCLLIQKGPYKCSNNPANSNYQIHSQWQQKGSSTKTSLCTFPSTKSSSWSCFASLGGWLIIEKYSHFAQTELCWNSYKCSLSFL